MSILRGFRLFQVFLVILVCLVSLPLLPSFGYCDDWVYVEKSDKFSLYYNRNNININRESKQIKVWVQYRYTEIGKSFVINERKEIKLDITGFDKLTHNIKFIQYDYNNLRYNILKSSYYSSSKILDSVNNSDIDWRNIISESNTYYTLDKILRDYNINRY
jgi:hypothetical protein